MYGWCALLGETPNCIKSEAAASPATLCVSRTRGYVSGRRCGVGACVRVCVRAALCAPARVQLHAMVMRGCRPNETASTRRSGFSLHGRRAQRACVCKRAINTRTHAHTNRKGWIITASILSIWGCCCCFYFALHSSLVICTIHVVLLSLSGPHWRTSARSLQFSSMAHLRLSRIRILCQQKWSTCLCTPCHISRHTFAILSNNFQLFQRATTVDNKVAGKLFRVSPSPSHFHPGFAGIFPSVTLCVDIRLYRFWFHIDDWL